MEAKRIPSSKEIAQNQSRVTFVREFLGEFKVFLDGQETGYRIHNGSRGMSGRDTVNIYCITRNGEMKKFTGSLHNCKAAVTFSILKEAL